MKVLHLLMGGGVGGIEVFCRDLARFSGQENVFYLVYSGGMMAQEIERCGGRVVVAGEKKQTLLPGLWRFLRFCKRERPDVIISHAGSVITRGFLAASARGPCVSFISIPMPCCARAGRPARWPMASAAWRTEKAVSARPFRSRCAKAGSPRCTLRRKS